MPTYEYACEVCGNRFDVRQSITADPLTACPTCDGRIKRVIHASGIVFKGSGFYKTDSRTTTKEAAGAGAGTTGEDKSTTSTEESKPAAEAKSADNATPATPTSEAKPAKPAAPAASSATASS